MNVNTSNAFKILVLSLCLTSCEKLVEVDPPIDMITNQSAYGNNENANATMIGVLFSYSWEVFTNNSTLEVVADNMDYYGPTYQDYYTNNLSSSVIPFYWQILYNHIYRTNSVIEGVSGSATISDNLKQTLIGEAKFLRAYHYFYMVNLFGDCPLIVSTDYKTNATSGRTSKADIYKFLVEELTACQNTLSETYTGKDGLSQNSNDRVRPNKYAATALLAKVYLYLNEYDKAEAECNKIIQQANTYLLEDLDKVFVRESKEAIWQLQPSLPDFNTDDAKSYIIQSKPGQQYFYALPQSFVRQFSAADKRLSTWVGHFVDDSETPNKTYYYPYKYKAITKAVDEPFSEYYMMFRLAEIYLIRAEAKAQLQKYPEASADLNEIRNRAGLADIQLSSKEPLLAQIAQQRALELFTEGGNRWLDLKRTGTIDSAMNIASQRKGSSWSTTDQLFPIPTLEMQKNPNLKPQNPGYN
jgi:hypothetical protein